MKRRGATSGDGSHSRSAKRPRKPRAKGAPAETVARSGDYELDLDKFPDKMRWLLDNEVAPEALWWLPEGDAIGINKRKFQEELLVQEFRGNKFSSITRKLNRWGFRRVDDQERVREGAIAYSHDFFIQSSVSMMRFMKKEEDRKPPAEEDAKSSEDTNSSLLSLLGESSEGRQASTRLGLGEGAANAPAVFDLQAGRFHASTYPFPLPASFMQRQLQANSITSTVQLQGNSALQGLFPRNSFHNSGLSLRNQLAMSMQNQQQVLREEILLQERQEQLRRLGLSTARSWAATSHPRDTAQALWRRANQSESPLLPFQGPTNPLQGTSASHGNTLGLFSARLRAAELANLERLNASMTNVVDAAGLITPPVASLDVNADPHRMLLRQQHQQIEQDRLALLRRQLSQPNVDAASFAQRGENARNFIFDQPLQLSARAKQEKKEEEKQRGGNRSPRP